MRTRIAVRIQIQMMRFQPHRTRSPELRVLDGISKGNCQRLGIFSKPGLESMYLMVMDVKQLNPEI